MGLPQKAVLSLLSLFLGDQVFLPPPVFFFSFLMLLCSFLALLTILRHFSFTSITDLLQILREFTQSVICSQILILFLFVRVLENFMMKILMSMFSSADSKVTVHSAAVKFGFLALFSDLGSSSSAMFDDKNFFVMCGLGVRHWVYFYVFCLMKLRCRKSTSGCWACVVLSTLWG